ncbi:MAG: hypothetical protein ACE5E5_10355, partial [Phycisphaerae bacterium]
MAETPKLANPIPNTPAGGTPRAWEVGVPDSTYSVVNTHDGNLVTTIPIIGWSGKGPTFNMVLYHNGLSSGASLTEPNFGAELGRGSSMAYSAHLIVDEGVVTFVADDGSRDVFVRDSFVGPTGGPIWKAAPGVFNVLTQEDGTWILTHKDQSYHVFDEEGKLKSVVDALGYQIGIFRTENPLAMIVIHEGASFLSQTRRLEIHKEVVGEHIVISKIVDPIEEGVDLPIRRSWDLDHDASGRLTTITNPMGGVISIAYDSNGRITGMIDQRKTSANPPEPDHEYTFTYAGSRVATVTDPTGAGGTTGLTQTFSTHFDQGAGERTMTYTDRQGAAWKYVYDTATGMLSRTISPFQETRVYGFDAQRNLTLYRDPLGNEWTQTYDIRGNLLTAADPLGHLQSWTYDALNNLTSATDQLGHETTLLYEDPFGPTLLTSVVEPQTESDESAAVTTISYYHGHPDQPNGMIATVTDPNGVRTTFEYDQWG